MKWFGSDDLFGQYTVLESQLHLCDTIMTHLCSFDFAEFLLEAQWLSVDPYMRLINLLKIDIADSTIIIVEYLLF